MSNFEKNIQTLNNSDGLLQGLKCFYQIIDSNHVSVIKKAQIDIKNASLLYLETLEKELHNTKTTFADKVKQKKSSIPEINKDWAYQEIKTNISEAITALESLPQDTRPEYLDDFIQNLSCLATKQRDHVITNNHMLKDVLSSIVCLRQEMEG